MNVSGEIKSLGWLCGVVLLEAPGQSGHTGRAGIVSSQAVSGHPRSFCILETPLILVNKNLSNDIVGNR